MRKNIFTAIILVLLSIFNYYLKGLSGILEMILGLIIYTLIFYFFYIIFSKIRKKMPMMFEDFIKYFLYRVSILVLFLGLFFGGGTYLINNYFPAKMPEFTISNGEKTVKFQAMVHIGQESYYNEVKENLEEFKNNGGVYYFEGVKGGTQENMQDFNEALGINFTPDLYENFSKLYGVTFQDNSMFLGLVNNKDYNVDLSIDQIMEIYNQKTETSTGETKQNIEIPMDVNKEIINTLAELNPKELKLLVYLNQAILNLLIESDSTQELLTNNFANKELFDVILNERNKVLAKEIISSEHEKIYVTYGLLHFKGVLELLKQNDSNWQIIETKYLYPITNKKD